MHTKSILVFLIVVFELASAHFFWRRPYRVPIPSHDCDNHTTSSIDFYKSHAPYDLTKLNDKDLEKFFNSFDSIITSVEGVILNGRTGIPEAIDTLNKLKNSGKNILFLTNNSLYPMKGYIQLLSRMGFCDVSPDDIILPSSVLSWHLKNLGCIKKAYVIGNKYFKEALAADGIDIIVGPNSVKEDFSDLPSYLAVNKDVNAVIFDFDPNVNWAKIVQASEYLTQRNIPLFVGELGPVIKSETKSLLGAGPFVKILTDYTGKTGVSYVKPSVIVQDYIHQNYVLNDPKRILFIGNSLNDMKFAKNNGFTKLWIQSGEEVAKQCRNGCVGSPEYYISDLGTMPLMREAYSLTPAK